MRHRKASAKLSKTSSHRKAMFRNMVTSLFEHNKIKTTTPKAKELRSIVDKVITLAKKGDLHSRRNVLSIMRDKDIVHKLFETVTDRFGHTSSGYTRLYKIGLRRGDAASMSIVALFDKGKEDKKIDKKIDKKDSKFIEEKELKDSKTQETNDKDVKEVIDSEVEGNNDEKVEEKKEDAEAIDQDVKENKE